MSAPNTQKRPITQSTTLRGLAATVLFLIIASLAEYIVVLYAMNIGVQDQTLWQTSAQFPGTDWMITLVISPLFHLVPIAVIGALAFTWMYLTKNVARRTQVTLPKKETEPKFFSKLKSKLSKVKVFTYLEQRIRLERATIKGTLTVLLSFTAVILLVSLLAYPQLVYQAVSGAYAGSPSTLNFIKGTAQALSPIGQVFSAVNNGLLAAAPTFGGFVLSLGNLISPLTLLDGPGKYLVFQNAAAWIPALATLLYGEFMRRGYWLRRSKRS
jgi:hypothetical protein